MNAWDWRAGTRSGITDDRRRARRHAAAALRSGEAEVAVLQLVTVVTELPALTGRYVPVGRPLTGRRHGNGVRWGHGS